MATKKKTEGAVAGGAAAAVDARLSTLDSLGRDTAMVSIAELRPSPLNPRGPVSDEDVAELVESVREHGVLQPLLVRRVWIESADATRTGHCELEVIAGHRRLRAAQLAGIDKVRCVVLWDEETGGPEGSRLDDATVIELMLTENSSRRDVHPTREADAIGALVERYGRSVAELAARTGRSERWVRQRMALTRLIPEWRAMLEADRLSLGFAIRAAMYPDDVQRDVYARHAEKVPGITFGLHDMWKFEKAERPLSTAAWFLDRPVGDRPACATCIKRTDAQLQLLGETRNVAACIDVACWNSKLEHQRAAGRIVTKDTWNPGASDSGEILQDRQLVELVPAAEPTHWEDSAADEVDISDDETDVDEDGTTLADMAPDAVVWFESSFNPGRAVSRGVRVAGAVEALRATPDNAVIAESVERLARTAEVQRSSIGSTRSKTPAQERAERRQNRIDKRLGDALTGVADQLIALSEWGVWITPLEEVLDVVSFVVEHNVNWAGFTVVRTTLNEELDRVRDQGGWQQIAVDPLGPKHEAWQRAFVAAWFRGLRIYQGDTDKYALVVKAMDALGLRDPDDPDDLPDTLSAFYEQVDAFYEQVDALIATTAVGKS